MKVTNIVLIALGLFLLAFVAAMLITFWRFQAVPDTLIDKVLDVSQWEAGALALIKVTKVVRDGFGRKKESEE